MNLDFRLMAPDDKPVVLEFLRREFGEKSIQCKNDRFEWQCEKYPGAAKVYLCFDEHEMVGQVVFLPVRLLLGSAFRSAAFSIDTMVSEKYRRKGIGEGFHRLRLENYDVALSSGASDANRRLYEKMGWMKLGKYFEFRLVRKPPKISFRKCFAKDCVTYFRYLRKAKNLRRGGNIEVTKTIPHEAEHDLNRGQEGEAFLETDRGYLEWRYDEHPYFDYKYVQAWKRGKSLGFCLLREFLPDRYKLVDLYCRRENVRSFLGELAHGLDAYSIEGEMVGVPLVEEFLDVGFRVTWTDQFVTGSAKDTALVKLMRQSNWIVFMGDSDGDR